MQHQTLDMRIRQAKLIEEFCRKHADATEPLDQWVRFIKAAQWKTPNELKADYPSADFVGNGRWVFNIKGNHYRLITIVVFRYGVIDLRFIGTHDEYNKIKNIKEI